VPEGGAKSGHALAAEEGEGSRSDVVSFIGRLADAIGSLDFVSARARTQSP
jgi:hypothetical protein